MEARGLVGSDRNAVLDDEQFSRIGRDLVFGQANPLAGGERAAEARFGEFFRDRLPSERLRFRDREGQRNGLAHEACEGILPGGVGAARDDDLAAGRVDQVGAVGEPNFEPIAELRHRADGRARGADCVTLLDCDRGTDVLRGVEGRRGEEFEELADVRAEGLDVAALAFGVECVEDQG